VSIFDFCGIDFHKRSPIVLYNSVAYVTIFAYIAFLQIKEF